MPVSLYSPVEAEKYQNYLIGNGYNPKTVNTKIDYLRGIFRALQKNGTIANNPFALIDSLKEKESTAHQLFAPDEIQRIKAYAENNQLPELWNFALLIYYCFLRPETIMYLKPQNFDLKNGLLTIEAATHKNNKNAIKQLLQPHLKYLAPFLAKIPSDYFIFSKNMQPGKNKMPPTRAAEYWKKHVKQTIGINKNAYGLKATGAARFLENNPGAENLKWLQMQLSHADLQTTSIYTNKLKTVLLNENNTVIELL